MTLDDVAEQLSSQTIEEAYEFFAFDYAGATTVDQLDQEDPRRDRFLRHFDWRVQPTTEIVRRFFNQVNTAFAERWLLAHPYETPSAMLLECNRLALFQQGKSIGWRVREVEFGVRNYLDFMDPLRRSKWLRGLSPHFLAEAIDEWASSVCEGVPTLQSALILAMAGIAVHPFSDANGRVGRLVLTWLCQRWNLGLSWLNEGPDGELLRTGHGIKSTEYLMAMLLIHLTGGHNVVDPGARTRDSSNEGMLENLRRRFNELRLSDPPIVHSQAFIDLTKHFRGDGHLRTTSPRFESLRSALT